jgi:TolB-like protein
MKFLFAGLLTLGFIIASSAQDSKPSIAVNDLVAKGVNATDADIISERIRVDLVNSGVFRVMERGQMAEILKEQGFQKSGICNEKSCIVEVGQLLGVQRILAGTVGKVGSTYEISISLIDVATGEMLFATTEDCRCSIDEVLLTSTSNIVKKILQRTTLTPTGVESAQKPKLVTQSALPVAKPKIAPLWLKIATGALAVCTGVGGYYADTKVQGYVKSNSNAYSTYSKAPTHTAYLAYRSIYNQNCDAAKKYGTYRNILYGVSVLSCAGFAVTFFF